MVFTVVEGQPLTCFPQLLASLQSFPFTITPAAPSWLLGLCWRLGPGGQQQGTHRDLQECEVEAGGARGCHGGMGSWTLDLATGCLSSTFAAFQQAVFFISVSDSSFLPPPLYFKKLW